jgi:hypothetical protein
MHARMKILAIMSHFGIYKLIAQPYMFKKSLPYRPLALISPACRTNLLLRAEIQRGIELASLLGTYLNLAAVIPRSFTMNPYLLPGQTNSNALPQKEPQTKVAGAHCIHKFPISQGYKLFSEGTAA